MSSRVDDTGAADDEAYVESEEEAAVASEDEDEVSSDDEDSVDEDDVHPAGRRSGRNAIPGAHLPLSAGPAVGALQRWPSGQCALLCLHMCVFVLHQRRLMHAKPASWDWRLT
jgi:hypothetical protein